MSTRRRRTTAALTAAATLIGAVAVTAMAGPAAAAPPAGHGPTELRVATYNLSLNRNAPGQLVADLSTGTNAQAKTVAEVIQHANPDIVLLNEFDYVPGNVAVDLFRDNYLEVPQGTADAVEYPYAFVAPSNTGIASGFDLNNNGAVVTTPLAAGYGDDAFGFGAFPGQFGMAVLSKYPIDADAVRTFQHFLWKDMPGALLPDDPNTAAPADWYSPEELDVFRLSSKSHWDVPVEVGRQHRARARVAPDAAHVRRRRGPQRPAQPRRDPVLGRLRHAGHGLPLHLRRRRRHRRAQARRVVRDPRRPERRPARRRLGGRPRSTSCSTTRASPTRCRPPRARPRQPCCRAARTSPTWATRPRHGRLRRRPAPGNLRADYVLPSRDLRVLDAAVFWPVQADPLSALTGTFPFPSSDHRLVWVDLRVHP